MSYDDYIRACPRCGEEQSWLFGVWHMRAWWENNEKTSGLVCWKCANKIDYAEIERRNKGDINERFNH